MKYKVGDKVRIKPKFHFCSVDGFNNINMKDEFFNEYSRLLYCETVMTIGIVNKDFYILKEDRWAYKWTDEMIERLVKDESNDYLIKNDCKDCVFAVPKWFHCGLRGFRDDFDVKNCSAHNTVLPNGFELQEDGYFSWVNKKKEYPKTYEECAEIIAELTGSDCNPKGCMGYMSVQLTALQKLLICRDAYWKIAGEEMGLGKPWEPDWENEEDLIHCITTDCGKIYCTGFRGGNEILAFPTAEMRDAFYENFKEEIEQCKELL